jgi:hypothetical protein
LQLDIENKRLSEFDRVTLGSSGWRAKCDRVRCSIEIEVLRELYDP